MGSREGGTEKKMGWMEGGRVGGGEENGMDGRRDGGRRKREGKEKREGERESDGRE